MVPRVLASFGPPSASDGNCHQIRPFEQRSTVADASANHEMMTAACVVRARIAIRLERAAEFGRGERGRDGIRAHILCSKIERGDRLP